MGTYAYFFLATPDELGRAFVGWRRPLPQRAERQRAQPFSGRPITVLCWLPGPADAPAPAPFPAADLASRVGYFPTASFKNLDPLSLGELVAIALGDEAWCERIVDGSLPPPLVRPDEGDRGALCELPTAFLATVAAWTADDVARVADAWGQVALCDWSPEDHVDVLTELRALAGRGLREGKRLYYWM